MTCHTCYSHDVSIVVSHHIRQECLQCLFHCKNKQVSFSDVFHSMLPLKSSTIQSIADNRDLVFGHQTKSILIKPISRAQQCLTRILCENKFLTKKPLSSKSLKTILTNSSKSLEKTYPEMRDSIDFKGSNDTVILEIQDIVSCNDSSIIDQVGHSGTVAQISFDPLGVFVDLGSVSDVYDVNPCPRFILW